MLSGGEVSVLAKLAEAGASFGAGLTAHCSPTTNPDDDTARSPAEVGRTTLQNLEDLPRSSDTCFAHLNFRWQMHRVLNN